MKSPFGLRPTASIVAVLLFGRAAILGGPAGPVYIPTPVPAADQALTIAMKHIKAREKVDAAVKVLHDEFELGKEKTRK